LFFTERQLVYICNRGNSSDISSSGSLAQELLLDPRTTSDTFDALLPPLRLSETSGSLLDTLLLAMKYLEEYSTRKLSYDADALNAIVGALNVLRKVFYPATHHIWGVPIHVSTRRREGFSTRYDLQSKEHQSLVELGLYWYHESHARRRHGFPSWSPLGWEGPIKWMMDASGKEKRPVVTSARDYSLGTGSGSQSLRRLIDTGQIYLEKMSHYLTIEAMTAPLRLVEEKSNNKFKPFPVYDGWYDNLSKPNPCNHCVTHLYDGDEDNTFAVLWDMAPYTIANGGQIKAVRFSKRWVDDVREMPIMIVQQIESTRYKRIGISWLPDNHEIFQTRDRKSFVEETVTLG
jgi:hypothetical protein